MTPTLTPKTQPAPPASVSAALLEGVLDLLPAGVIALDRERSVRYVNSAGLQALGLEAEDLDRDEGVLRLLEQEAVAEALEAAREDGQERRIAVFVEGDGDHPLEVGLSVVPQTVEGAAVIATVLVFRALDDGRSLGERMREIEYQAATGRLAAGFAHEVRNPIAAIQGLAEGLLEELPEGSPLLEYAQRILRLVDRLEGLVRSCLDLGGATPSLTQPIAPRELVEAAIRRAGAEDRVQVEIDPHTPDVAADAPQTIGCLQALVANAVEACEPPAEIGVRVRAAGGDLERVLFEVHDRGPGIPAHLLGRVFEPFFTTKPGSTGLGLAVARLVASRNRGSIEVRSRRGETVFALALPAAIEPAEAAS